MSRQSFEIKIVPPQVVFQVGGPPVVFGIDVTNLSGQPAQFQIHLDAARVNQAAHLNWYKVTPESFFIAAGDLHRSQVYILDTPPELVDSLQLPVLVYCHQLRETKRGNVRLEIQGFRAKAIQLDLPRQEFSVYPRNPETIPVRVENLTSQSLETRIQLTGIDPNWIVNGAERVLPLGPRGRKDISFQIQSPALHQVASDRYPFQVKAFARNALDGRVDGWIEVLPIGMIHFEITPEHQAIPNTKAWVPNWSNDPVEFHVKVTNSSNLLQQVSFQLQEKRDREINHQLQPPALPLNLGQASSGTLEVAVSKRPWVGWGKTLELEARPLLSDPRHISIEPASQTLWLKLFPVIPLWLQILVLLLLVSPLWWLRPYVGHTDRVTSVHFVRDQEVFSGSDDCTVRRWAIEETRDRDRPYRLKPLGGLGENLETTCQGNPNPKGILTFTGKPVRAIASFENKQNNDFWIAAGLQNGTIQLHNVLTPDKTCPDLKGDNDTVDRVFALALTRDALKLYSGHGSGTIRIWQRQEGCFSQALGISSLRVGAGEVYEIRSLVLSRDDARLVSSGSGERLLVWRFDLLQVTPEGIDIPPSQQISALLDGFSGVENIWDIAFLPESSLLATADSNGYIALWDLDQCVNNVRGNLARCELRESWQATKSSQSAQSAQDKVRSVRSLRFSQDGHYLVSGGDDGRVMVWPLTAEGKRREDENDIPLETVVFEGGGNRPINSVDLIERQQDFLVVSGSGDHQVRLHVLDRADLEPETTPASPSTPPGASEDPSNPSTSDPNSNPANSSTNQPNSQASPP